MWDKIENGTTIGQQGSENGCIIADEEYKKSCRITLEINTEIAPYSITCGIYGLTCHTIFASNENEVIYKYDVIKKELETFIDTKNDNEDEIGEWCKQFTTRW